MPTRSRLGWSFPSGARDNTHQLTGHPPCRQHHRHLCPPTSRGVNLTTPTQLLRSLAPIQSVHHEGSDQSTSTQRVCNTDESSVPTVTIYLRLSLYHTVRPLHMAPMAGQFHHGYGYLRPKSMVPRPSLQSECQPVQPTKWRNPFGSRQSSSTVFIVYVHRQHGRTQSRIPQSERSC